MADHDELWEELLDESSGTYYYHNSVTGETAWEKPAFLTDVAESEWETHWSDEHQNHYYVHKHTGETAWASEKYDENEASSRPSRQIQPLTIGPGKPRGDVQPSDQYLPPGHRFRARSALSSSESSSLSSISHVPSLSSASASAPNGSSGGGGGGDFLNPRQRSQAQQLKSLVDELIYSTGGAHWEDRVAADSVGKDLQHADAPPHPLLYHRLAILQGHTAKITGLLVIDNCIISSSLDRTLKVWCSNTGGLVKTLEGHSKGVEAIGLCCGKDENEADLLVSGSADNTIRVWRWRNEAGQELVQTIKAHDDGISVIATDAGVAVSGSFDTTLKVWDIGSGKETQTMTGHSAAISAVAIEGIVVISASRDGIFLIWEHKTGHVTGQIEDYMTAFVTSLYVTGSLVVASSNDCFIKVWNFNTLEMITEIEGDDAVVTSIAGISKSSRKMDKTVQNIIASSTDGSITVWNIQTGAKVQTVVGPQADCALHAIAIGSESVAVGGEDQMVRIYPVEDSDPRSVAQLKGHTGKIVALAIEGNHLVSGSQDKRVQIWDLTTQTAKQALSVHTSKVSAVGLHNGMIVSADEAKYVCLHKLHGVSDTPATPGAAASVVLPPFAAHDSAVFGVAMDGEEIVSCSRDQTIRVWNVTDGHLLYKVEEKRAVTAVAMHDDVIVTGSKDSTIRIWSRKEQGRLLLTLDAPSHGGAGELIGHIGPISSLAVDHEYVASGSFDKTVKLWNRTRGNLIWSRSEHAGAVSAVTMAAGLVVSTAMSPDKFVRLWVCETGGLLRSFEGHSEGITALAVAGPLGARDDTNIQISEDLTIVTGSSDKTIKVFCVNLLEELPRAIRECRARDSAFEEVASLILVSGLAGLELALDWLMRTDALTGRAFMHEVVMPNPAAVPLVSVLATALGRDLLRYLDPLDGKKCYEVSARACRRAMDFECFILGRYRLLSDHDRSVSESNKVFFAEDTAACDTYGYWFDAETQDIDGGAHDEDFIDEKYLDLTRFKYICKKHDIIRRSIGFGPYFLQQAEESTEEAEIARHFAHNSQEKDNDQKRMRRDAFVSFCTSLLGSTNRVALKFMQDEASFNREVKSRYIGHLDPHYVMPMNFSYDLRMALDDNKMSADPTKRSYLWWRLDPRFSEYDFILAMEAGNRNLEQIIISERVDFTRSSDLLRQIASALSHVHDRGFVHCDAKPKNCVRLESGRFVLIDLDAMLPIGEYFGERDFSSGFMPPEALRNEVEAVLPIGSAANNGNGGEIFTARAFEYDAEYMRVNRRTKESMDDAQLLKVDTTFDVWSLGIIAHMLVVQGAHPFAATNRDDSLRPSDLQKLARWDFTDVISMADNISRVLRRMNEDLEMEQRVSAFDRFAAIDLTAWLLQPSASHRPASSSDIMQHPFLNRQPDRSSPCYVERTVKQRAKKLRRPILHLAAAVGDTKLLESELGKAEVDPNKRDSVLHETPLHRAAKETQLDIVQYLLAMPEISPSCQDAVGDTPFIGFVKYIDAFWTDPERSFANTAAVFSERATYRQMAELFLEHIDVHGEFDAAGRSAYDVLVGSAVPELRGLAQTVQSAPVDSSVRPGEASGGTGEAAKAPPSAMANAVYSTPFRERPVPGTVQIHVIDETIEKLKAENDHLRALNEIAKVHASESEVRIKELEAALETSSHQLQITNSEKALLLERAKKHHPSKLRGNQLLGARIRLEGHAGPGTVTRFEKNLSPLGDSRHFVKFDDNPEKEVPVVLARAKHGRTIGKRFILQSDENIC